MDQEQRRDYAVGDGVSGKVNENGPMLSEYDVVRLRTDLDHLKAGTKGAVVGVYSGDPPEYEVEFVSDSGETLAVKTVTAEQIEKVVAP